MHNLVNTQLSKINGESKEMRRTFSMICVATLIACVTAYSAPKQNPEKFQANKESLERYQVPEWYKDAKLGIWPIWGPYSVPAYRGTHAAEWYGRWMYCIEKEPETIKLSPKKRWNKYYDLLSPAIVKHHNETYGCPGEFGYHDFIPMWKAEKWDPDEWARFAEASGAKFFTVLATFHDGFSLYNSDITEWDSVKKGPKRDICVEMKEALKDRQIKFGVSNHFAWNSSFYKYYFNNGYAKGQEEYADLYSRGVMDEAYMKRWWDRTVEMVDKLDPDLYYFDWGWHEKPWVEGKYHEKFTAYYYNHALKKGMSVDGNPNVVLNSKFRPMETYTVHDLERAKMSAINPHVWQTDTSVSDYSWGYSTEDQYKSAKSLITLLTDIVSKNGVLMLAFGPRADGTIPEEYSEPMLAMGAWLKTNGEAIYATRPWVTAEEGPTDANNKKAGDLYGAKDIRYTRSKDGSKLYAIAFGLPGAKLTLLSTKVKGDTTKGKITMLANGRMIPFEVNAKNQLVLDLSDITPANAGCEHAYAFRIEGLEVKGRTLTAIELSEVYLRDIKDYTPFPDTFASGYPYLSGAKPMHEKAHNGVKRDTNYHGKEILIGGQKFERGLMVCPAGEEGRGIFVIGLAALPQVSGLTAHIGIDDAAITQGSSEFIVETFLNGTWQQLFKSEVLTVKDQAVMIDVHFPAGSEFVRLITTDGGNGCSADHAVWADVKFTE